MNLVLNHEGYMVGHGRESSMSFQSSVPRVEGTGLESDYCLLCARQDTAANGHRKK